MRNNQFVVRHEKMLVYPGLGTSPTEQMEAIIFLFGIIFFYLKNIWLVFFLISVFFLTRRWIFPVIFFLGLLWAKIHNIVVAPYGIPEDVLVRPLHLSGTVSSIPNRLPHKTQFQFQTDAIDQHPAKATVLVTCYQYCPSIDVGQHWTLMVKMAQPRDYANPGGFHYVDWLSAKHISWLATMTRGPHFLHSRVSHAHPILYFREQLSSRLAQLRLKTNAIGITEALSLGFTAHLTQNLWDLFRRTGTTHLMVISGAHIGLVAGLVFSVTRWLWCRVEWLCLRIPAQQAAAVMSMMSAVAYAVLAGFAVPAQRSLIACCVMLSRYFLSWRFCSWQSWRYALFFVLVFEPHAIYLPGFYLSFMAVAVLILVNQRFVMLGLKKTLMIQGCCVFGLMPMTLFWFSYGAMNSILANFLAIPWVGFVIVPLSLLTTLLGSFHLCTALVWMLNQSIHVLLAYLNIIDRLSWMNLTYAYPSVLTPLGLLLFMALLLFFPIKQYRFLKVCLFLISIYPLQPKLKNKTVQVDVLDVGQGLAVVVRTASHTLLYDTGMKFYRGSDMGKMVILPYLKSLGIRHLDKVVISHPDMDHRGGLQSVQQAMSIDELIVDDVRKYQHASPCHMYPDWQWDQVRFHFFPIKIKHHSKNNTSCVLHLTTPQGQILLPGDIERQAEKFLVSQYGQQLRSMLIVVPHHGSKTSSNAFFLDMVQPKYAVLSYGFHNRYHFPHSVVIDRYHQYGTRLFHTVDCGMTRIVLDDKGISTPKCYRTTSV